MKNVGWTMVLCVLTCLTCSADALTSSVRSALDAYTNSVRRTAVRVETIRNVGVANIQGEAYRALCCMISNDVEAIFRQMPEITTNAAERLVLMSTALQGDENGYLDAYVVLADLAVSNQVSGAELEWFGSPERTDLSNCIRCRYRESRVTNLVCKITQVTGNTNWCNSVISGASYTNYLEEVAAGLWQ